MTLTTLDFSVLEALDFEHDTICEHSSICANPAQYIFKGTRACNRYVVNKFFCGRHQKYLTEPGIYQWVCTTAGGCGSIHACAYRDLFIDYNWVSIQ